VTSHQPKTIPSATIAAEAVSEVISHAAATSCIHEPMLETSAAIQSMRKTRNRSGSHGEPLGSASEALAPPVAVLVPWSGRPSRRSTSPAIAMGIQVWRWSRQQTLRARADHINPRVRNASSSSTDGCGARPERC